MMIKKLLTTEEVAVLLGKTPSTIGGWRFNQKGPKYIKSGGSIRYRLNDVESFKRRMK